MTRFGSLTTTALAACLATSVALPATSVASGLYGGVGGVYTNFDDKSNDSYYGTRLYGGYSFFGIPAVMRLGLEGGYTRTGKFEDNGGTDRYNNKDLGLQGTITTLPLINFHARAGYEWGDSDGAMVAVGGSMAVFPLTRIRAEYQERNDFDAGMLSIEVRLP